MCICIGCGLLARVQRGNGATHCPPPAMPQHSARPILKSLPDQLEAAKSGSIMTVRPCAKSCPYGRDTEQPGGTLGTPMPASSQPRPPEELLAALLEACRSDTAGGMHFWEVARSLRCAPAGAASPSAARAGSSIQVQAQVYIKSIGLVIGGSSPGDVWWMWPRCCCKHAPLVACVYGGGDIIGGPLTAGCAACRRLYGVQVQNGHVHLDCLMSYCLHLTCK